MAARARAAERSAPIAAPTNRRKREQQGSFAAAALLAVQLRRSPTLPTFPDCQIIFLAAVCSLQGPRRPLAPLPPAAQGGPLWLGALSLAG